MVFIYMYMNLIFCKIVVVFFLILCCLGEIRLLIIFRFMWWLRVWILGYFLNMFLLSCYYGVMISLKGLNECFIIYINRKYII